MNDSLGDRIKRYERAYAHHLTPRTPVLIRVDGRAFHTYTRGMAKPFDHGLMDAMRLATTHTAMDMQGFRLAYTQSDEATFLLHDFADLQTQAWFDYDHSKVVSITASLFTAHFNQHRMWQGYNGVLATFDARAFSVPAADVPNVFLWRQRDWERNSLQMLARAHFSAKQLHGKGHREIHDMLHGIGINWVDLSDAEKNGTFVRSDLALYEQRVGYDNVQELIDIARLDAES
jgi:tRNA(His) 5'-end guanylyltransferase